MSESAFNAEVPQQPAADASSSSMLPFMLAAIVGIGMAYGGLKWWQVRKYEAARAEGALVSVAPLPLDNFTLDERGGEPFRSATMRGKVWVTSYFFASCIGPCRILNGNIRELTNYPDLSDVTFVSITCDPDNDSLDVLKQYADQYRADPKRWLFCRADLDYLKGVARGMNLALFIKTHSDHMVVVDRAGKIRGMFDGTSKHECQQMRTLLHECLAEKPPETAEEPAGESEVDVGEQMATRTAEKIDLGSRLPPVDPSIECCEDELLQPAIRSGT